jgi:hypothetical protein
MLVSFGIETIGREDGVVGSEERIRREALPLGEAIETVLGGGNDVIEYADICAALAGRHRTPMPFEVRITFVGVVGIVRLERFRPGSAIMRGLRWTRQQRRHVRPCCFGGMLR